jgi:hypothetical protein
MKIYTEILSAVWTSPVIGRKNDERGYTDCLQHKKRKSRECSQEIRSLVKYCAQQHDEHCCRDGHDLPVLSHPELLLDLVCVLLLHGSAVEPSLHQVEINNIRDSEWSVPSL